MQYSSKEVEVPGNLIRFPVKAFFKDDLVNLVDSTMQKAKALKLAHQYTDNESFSGSHFSIDKKKYINFSTCSYLGIETHPKIKEGIIDFTNRYGASFIMSRAYASTSGFTEFELLLSKIFDAYPVVTPSTTLGHFSFMSVMIQKGDLILLDQSVHNSVQMAAATVSNKATVSFVRNNDIGKIEKLISKYSQQKEINNIWYFGDGIYSMSGIRCPVKELTLLLNKYPNFYCYLDDAHGMTTFGKNGRGYVLSQMDKIHERMVVAVSLSKAFGMGCGGALVFPHQEWQRKVRTCGPTMIFSSPVPPPMLGGGIAAAKLHLTDEIGYLQSELEVLVKYFVEVANDADLQLEGDKLSPIQFVKIGQMEPTFEIIRRVFDDGFFVSTCAFPAVPKHKCGIRITITRHVNRDLIDGLVRSLKAAIMETSRKSDKNSKLIGRI